VAQLDLVRSFMSAVDMIVIAIWAAFFLVMFIMMRRIQRRHGKKALSTIKNAPLWLNAFAVVTLVNFFAFCYVAGKHGGDAWNGYHQGGHYFLGAKGGFYIPVSGEFWRYSYYHQLSTWVSFMLLFIGLLWHINRSQMPKT